MKTLSLIALLGVVFAETTTCEVIENGVKVIETIEWVTVYTDDCCKATGGLQVNPTMPAPKTKEPITPDPKLKVTTTPAPQVKDPAPKVEEPPKITKPKETKPEKVQPVPKPKVETKPPTKPPNEAEDFIHTVLTTMNNFRARHGVAPLTWDATLASYAEQHTETCDFTHTYGPYGENLAEGYDSVTAAITFWYDEINSYSYSQPGFTEATGHFSQLVWKDTRESGCHIRDCSHKLDGWYLMCEFSPAGNIVGDGGSYFKSNVLPRLY